MTPRRRRPSDIGRQNLLTFARDAIVRHGGSAVARVFFKYTCLHCRRRVRVHESNVLPMRAKCGACHAWSTITRGGFDLEVRTPGASWRAGSGLIVRTHDLSNDERADSSEIDADDADRI